MNTITVKPNQSMLDMVIQGTGSMEAGIQFCMDNNIALSDIPDVGTHYTVTDAATEAGSKDVLAYLRRNNIVVGTLGILPGSGLECKIALYPYMLATKNPVHAAIHPHTLGYWDFLLVGPVTEFITLYRVPVNNYLSDPNPLGYLSKTKTIAGIAPGLKNSEGPALMVDWNSGVNWHIPYNMLTNDGQYVILQSAIFTDGSEPTLLFQDLHFNEAMVAPCVILDGNSQNILDSLLPKITADVVSGDISSVTLRLTISHAVAASPDWATINMFFIDEAASGTPDPSDPGNPNKTIVTLGLGTHTFGALAQYVYTDGITTLGYSAIEMVMEVS